MVGTLLCFGILGLIVLSAIGSIAWSAGLGWRARERWGVVLSQQEAGTGAYRTGPTTQPRLRGVPWTVMVSGVLGAGLAPLTALFFAPAGLVGALMLSQSRGLDWLAPVLGLAALNGFPLSVGLFRVAKSTLACELGSAVMARRLGLWTVFHHGWLALALAIASVVDGAPWGVPLAFTAPGLIHAILTLWASAHVRAIQAALSPEEHAALENLALTGSTELPSSER